MHVIILVIISYISKNAAPTAPHWLLYHNKLHACYLSFRFPRHSPSAPDHRSCKRCPLAHPAVLTETSSIDLIRRRSRRERGRNSRSFDFTLYDTFHTRKILDYFIQDHCLMYTSTSSNIDIATNFMIPTKPLHRPAVLFLYEPPKSESSSICMPPLEFPILREYY